MREVRQNFLTLKIRLLFSLLRHFPLEKNLYFRFWSPRVVQVVSPCHSEYFYVLQSEHHNIHHSSAETLGLRQF